MIGSDNLPQPDTPTITQEHRDKLIAARAGHWTMHLAPGESPEMEAEGGGEAPLTRQEKERLETQARETHRKRQSQRGGKASVIDAFNQAHSIEALLDRHGYAKGTHGRYIRPGGKSESVSVKDGRSCHWSSNDPLNDGKVVSGAGVHDAFDVFSHFEHRGNTTAAVKAAADLPAADFPQITPARQMLADYPALTPAALSMAFCD